MPKVSFNSLAVVLAVAFLVPLLLGFVPRVRVPAVVVEILAGIVVGPQVLGWAHADEPVQILALVGLAFLLFLAGLEIDTSQLKGQLLRVAGVGFGLSVLLALAVGAGLDAFGVVHDPLFAAVILLSLLFSKDSSDTGTRWCYSSGFSTVTVNGRTRCSIRSSTRSGTAS